MEGLSHLAIALASLAGPWQIAYALAATLAGILIGLLPGLSATLGVALFTTLTVKMAPFDAILVLVCVYVGAIYGGSRTAILLNIPGTAANAAACLDGNMLARQGQAGRAMGIATTGSVAGSLFGVVCLAMFTPLLAETALKFGATEFFWLGIVGVMMSGSLTGSEPVKGWLMGLLGVFMATIGLDPVHAFERFTFGENALTGGISLIPALVGAFGFAEVLTLMTAPRLAPLKSTIDSVLPPRRPAASESGHAGETRHRPKTRSRPGSGDSRPRTVAAAGWPRAPPSHAPPKPSAPAATPAAATAPRPRPPGGFAATERRNSHRPAPRLRG